MNVSSHYVCSLYPTLKFVFTCPSLFPGRNLCIKYPRFCSLITDPDVASDADDVAATLKELLETFKTFESSDFVKKNVSTTFCTILDKRLLSWSVYSSAEAACMHHYWTWRSRPRLLPCTGTLVSLP